MKTLVLAMLLMAAVGTSGAQAAQSKNAYMNVAPGNVAWFDITSTNLKTSETFYSKVFGWKYEPVTGTNLALFIVAGDKQIGTLRGAEGKISPANGVVYITVDDIQVACRKFRDAGGKIETGFPFNLSEGKGAIALGTDPSQHPIGMYSKKMLPAPPKPAPKPSAHK